MLHTAETVQYQVISIHRNEKADVMSYRDRFVSIEIKLYTFKLGFIEFPTFNSNKETLF